MLHFIHYLQKLRLVRMVGKITDVLLSYYQGHQIMTEALHLKDYFFSDQEGNDKTNNKSNERFCQPDLLHLHLLLFLLLIILGTSNVNTVIITKYIRMFQELWSLLTKAETS